MTNHAQVMSPPETNRLAELEKMVARGLKRAVEIGLALGVIHEMRLYKHEYRSFEKYCRAKLGCGRQQAYRLIKAAATGKGLRVGTSAHNNQMN